MVLHGIPFFLEDSWLVTYPTGIYRYSSNEFFSGESRSLLHQKESINWLKNQSHITFCLHLKVSGRTTGRRSHYNPQLHTLSARKRKLDLTGANEMNRLYPNSRRESIKEDKYLNTLPRRGEDGGRSGLTKTKQKYVTRAGMEERKEGGLTAPKTRSRSTKNAVGMKKCCEIFFFFCSWDEKMDGDCKAKLAAGTVGFEAGVSLFTDPISDVGKCI
ncbi:hypothetical protein TNCV_1191561 [Trichonephila clavipes]|nr:hypothetical protein TNCV_1191561 [Trichonephila clavipes]